MLFPRLFAGLVFTAVAIGCARGDRLTGTGGGNNDGGSSSDGAGNTGGDGPSTNVTQPTNNTTTGPMCDEQPCKLVAPQCGCPMGACTADDTGSRVCVEEGPAQQGDGCNESVYCAAGFVCVGYEDALTSCTAYCENDSSCEAPGGKCVLGLTGAPTVKLCSDNCSPVGGTGCSVGGTGCQLAISADDIVFTSCYPSGTGTEGADCEDDAGCAPGFGCFPLADNSGNKCFRWCNANSPNCPNSSYPECTGFTDANNAPLTLGGAHYGACNPAR